MAKFLLNTSQTEAVSDFSIDVAKGLMLAGILGQGFINVNTGFAKTVSTICIIAMSLMFLYFGVQLRKKIKKW